MQRALATLLVLSFFVLNARQERRFRKQGLDPRGALPIARPLFVLAKLSMVITWLSVIVQSYLFDLRWMNLGSSLPWLSVLLEGLGILVIWAAFRDLGEANQIGLTEGPLRLRSTGIYRFSRNPMYVGFHILTLAAIIYTVNPGVLALGLFSLGAHHAIVIAEEKHLAAGLGTTYAEYLKRVRRYL